LNKDEKEILCDLLQQARDEGIHDTLVYPNEQIKVENLKISRRYTTSG